MGNLTGLVHNLDEQLHPLNGIPVPVADDADDGGTSRVGAVDLPLDPEEALLRGDVDLRASGPRPCDDQEREHEHPDLSHLVHGQETLSRRSHRREKRGALVR